MSFLTPFALAWAALTIPIVVFYVLKVRLRQAPVSTIIFWQQIYDDKSPRSLWQQLRHWLSLLVQILWLLLLVAALAEPFFRSEVLQARRIVLVIDNSASMNATDVSPTRLEAAKRAARNLVAALRFRDEMAVIAAGTQPQVVCGLTGHERTLQTAIERIAHSDGPTRVPDAIELAKRLLAGAPHGQVVVYSDGGFKESEKLASDPLVQFQPIGTAVANVGITQFQVRRSELDPVGYEILVEVVNAADVPTECRLNLDLNGSPVDVVPLNLAPGENWSQTFEKTSVDGGLLVAKLDANDALAVDNESRALLPKRELQRVLLVSPGNLFLQKAFEANPLVELKTAKALPEKFEPGVIHVFHRLVPTTMPPGSSFVVDPMSGSDLWTVGEPLENPIVTKQDADSPLMRHLRLDNVMLPQARQLKPPEEAQTLVGAVSGDPLYFSFHAADRKMLVLTVNLDQGDLTFRTAFPIMVTNALGWFAGQAGELRESLVAGAVAEAEIPPPPSGQTLVLRTPSGQLKPLAAGLTKLSVGPLDEVGLWGVESAPTPLPADAKALASPSVHQWACNLASREESDLRLPEAWRDKAAASLAATNWFVRPIWFYLLAIAVAVAFVEWFLYQRRWIS